jgi:hypothetical protein
VECSINVTDGETLVVKTNVTEMTFAVCPSVPASTSGWEAWNQPVCPFPPFASFELATQVTEDARQTACDGFEKLFVCGALVSI